MNREILFRGKTTDSNEWVYGWLADGNMICNWNNQDKHSLEVKASTVGQYTGLKDQYDKKIFEGDVLAVTIFDYNDCDTQYKVKVVWSVAGFDCINIKNDDNVWDLWWVHRLDDEIEVVGNIYDNPELLKGQ